MKKKYLKCFSDKKANELKNAGYEFLYEQNGVYYFENNETLTAKFSEQDILKDTKFSLSLNF